MYLAYTAWQLVIGAVGAAAPPLASAPQLTCVNVRLASASGVIGPKHRYTFSAHCAYEASTCKSWPGGSKCTNTISIHFDVLGSGEWVRATGIATEKLKFTGSATGVRFASGTNCTQDPWLKDPPSAGSCGHITITASLESPGPVPEVLIKPEVFLLARKIMLEEAKALSQSVASNNPPPPPPAPTPMPQPTIPTARIGDRSAGNQVMASAPTSIPAPRSPLPPPAVRLVTEGEELVKTGSFEVTGGRVGAQLMGGFGPGWSGNAQLLWVDGAVGAVLDLIVKVPASGKYALELHMTRAPDYGIVSVEVAGTPAAKPFFGYRQTVLPSGGYPIGTFPLTAGKNRVGLKIIGKALESTGYLVGVDKLVFTRVGA
jgi:hypothetical protein